MTAPIHETYPLGLRLDGRRVVVVGGGPVAARRTRGLLDAGAIVAVVAPYVCEDLAELLTAHGPGAAGHAAHAPAAVPARDARLSWVRRDYLTGDLDGAWLVQTATGDARVDAEVAADAEADRVFCVTAGDAERATAWVPAVARTLAPGASGAGEAEVTVAINAGRDPRRAQRVRDAVAVLLKTGELPLRAVRPARAVAAGSGDAGHEATGAGPVTAPLVRPVGSVALVGGGPGDAGLISVRGRRVLAEADVVVVDRLAPRALLAELGDDVVVVDVGKTSGNHPVPQDEINRILVHHALVGKRVVRLKGGDPYVFGRGGEELDACRAHGVPVEVVPGVTSAVSVPAAAGIPVTHRGLSRGFTVLTGHEDVGKVPAARDHTVVLLMGVSRLAETAEALVAQGRSPDTPVAVVEDGYGPRQRTTVGTLATIAERAREAGVRPPAVTVVGDVVTLSPAWPPRTPPAPR
ncbi:uroporphyrinogen-III C-methyltransferase [Cellulosimicrobium funkei]|uniref:uroporphyrinogen-III C-methyltransferase n=1 Tax=Cellulosimicrobium funkei TaxID=264251 RepID=A0A4Y8R3H9_9MICO|nr:uroporphyrinogen-III C-methyltransferase [Cellulosimicrobium funkei]TFF11516.1 uroporphyrinogen-III C-methyltransferase [Cellulosimicrobium funkei]TGA75269.1 uroporphyrinogen-III C-methyltransferase [Cellulosimicrobium terreum]